MQKELKAKIDALAKKIALLCAEKNELMIRYAEGQTDLKVGDRVTYEGAKYVWELRAIKPGCSGEPKFFGAKIKKDGTPGKDVNDIYVPYKKELVRANVEVTGAARLYRAASVWTAGLGLFAVLLAPTLWK